jgi:FkbM family methyltransferase
MNVSNSQSRAIPLNTFNYLVNGRHGWFLANGNDFYIGNALIRYGEYGELEGQFLASLVKPGDAIVEVGANIGTHTIPLAQKVGAQGSVIAIEVQPPIFHYLCANIALNGLFNVTTHACGCGATSESMMIPRMDYAAPHSQNFGGVSLSRGNQGIPANVIPLDELLVGITKINLLKLDVEGMEGEVLKGATHTIAHHRPRIYLENDRPENSQALIEQLMAMDYRLWWHIPPLFNPGNYFGVQENVFGNVASFNMLCLPRETQTPVVGQTEITDTSFHPLRKEQGT